MKRNQCYTLVVRHEFDAGYDEERTEILKFADDKTFREYLIDNIIFQSGHCMLQCKNLEKTKAYIDALTTKQLIGFCIQLQTIANDDESYLNILLVIKGGSDLSSYSYELPLVDYERASDIDFPANFRPDISVHEELSDDAFDALIDKAIDNVLG